MKLRAIAIVALCLAMAGCSVQRRAERHLRRAVELCPELVQAKAHPIDTVLALAPPPDGCLLPIAALHQADTIAVRAQNGTFTAHADSAAITVTYRPDTLSYRYADTVWLPQVVVEPQAKHPERHRWKFLVGFIIGVGFTLAVIYAALMLDMRK